MAENENNPNEKAPVIIGVRFSKISKNYNFDASDIDGITLGDYVVVQTSRGWQLGVVAEFIGDGSQLELEKIKKIDRKATERDLAKRSEIKDSEQEASMRISKWIRELNVAGMKFIYTEISFDGNCVTFHYTSEDDKITNFKKLQDSLKRDYPKQKVNFHKIGPRDAAKYFGGMGACGLEMRCCARFLTDFDSISIRMAKTQGISLTPTDITGMCERLRCCLNYEYCQYRDAMKGMPKKNKRVMTPKGEGKVRDVYPLRKTVLVSLPETGSKEFPIEEIEVITAKPENRQQERNQPPNNDSQKNNRKK
ncbi:MAG TPA: stage 0 sporulation protein [Anaerolineaceae bacterium]|nr:stage 0 sporulation protein [Anaerolineaceae bacterium]